MIRAIAYIFIIGGISFDILGCIGMVRLPDVYNRLQASTKCVTLGTCGILFGVFVNSLQGGVSAMGMKALVCVIFLLLTSPVAAHALVRASHRSGFEMDERTVCDDYKEDNDLK